MPNSLPDRTEVVRLTTILEALVTEVRNLTTKVEELKDENVHGLEKKLMMLEAHQAMAVQRIETLEKNNTWLFRTLIGQGLTLVSTIVAWLIQTYI